MTPTLMTPVKTVDCRSRKRKPKNKPGIVIGWFFRFCLRLRQSSFHWRAYLISGPKRGGGGGGLLRTGLNREGGSLF